MTDQAEIRRLRALEELFAAFARHEDADRFRVYARHVGDLEPGALEQACTQAIRTDRWLPSIAELRERARPAIPRPSERREATPPELAEIIGAALDRAEWTMETGDCEAGCGGAYELSAALLRLLRAQGTPALCGRCVSARLHGEALH